MIIRDMEKKVYITPALYVECVEEEQVIAASVWKAADGSCIEYAGKNATAPNEADTKVAGDLTDIWN